MNTTTAVPVTPPPTPTPTVDATETEFLTVALVASGVLLLIFGVRNDRHRLAAELALLPEAEQWVTDGGTGTRHSVTNVASCEDTAGLVDA